MSEPYLLSDDSAHNAGQKADRRSEAEHSGVEVLEALEALVLSLGACLVLILGNVIAAVAGDFLAQLVQLFQTQFQSSRCQSQSFLLSSESQLERLFLLIKYPLDVLLQSDAIHLRDTP